MLYAFYEHTDEYERINNWGYDDEEETNQKHWFDEEHDMHFDLSSYYPHERHQLQSSVTVDLKFVLTFWWNFDKQEMSGPGAEHKWSVTLPTRDKPYKYSDLPPDCLVFIAKVLE